MATLPTGWHHHTALLGERPIHWVTAGVAPGAAEPTILFIHGSPGTWKAWRGFLADPGLSARAHLIAVDRPGFGLSGRGLAEPSLAQQAAAAAVALEGEDHGPTLVVGHSYGGPVASQLAADRPDSVDGLVLVAPSIDPELEEIRWYQRFAERLPFLVPVDLRTANREILPLAGELRRLEPRLADLTLPVTVIQGLDDRLVPPGNADFAERAFSGAHLQVERLEGVNHFIPWRQPETITAAIQGWLTRESSGSP
ncbi:MAG: alpha/beta hydrolase [Acidobacteriota bacterium]